MYTGARSAEMKNLLGPVMFTVTWMPTKMIKATMVEKMIHPFNYCSYSLVLFFVVVFFFSFFDTIDFEVKSELTLYASI